MLGPTLKVYVPGVTWEGKTTANVRGLSMLTAVGAIDPLGPIMLTSSVVNVSAWIGLSNVRTTEFTGAEAAPLGFDAMMRGPATIGAVRAE